MKIEKETDEWDKENASKKLVGCERPVRGKYHGKGGLRGEGKVWVIVQNTYDVTVSNIWDTDSGACKCPTY